MRHDGGKCCMENTRRDILKKIKSFIDDKDGLYKEKRVFLLAGVAGYGKTTIANSIASDYDTKGQLWSSFLFSSSQENNSKPVNLLRTISKDIAEKHPEMRKRLCDILKGNSSLCSTTSIGEQFQKFLKEPLDKVDLDRPVVIVQHWREG